MHKSEGGAAGALGVIFKKNNILPGGAPETARDLKAEAPYERKDTDID